MFVSKETKNNYGIRRIGIELNVGKSLLNSNNINIVSHSILCSRFYLHTFPIRFHFSFLNSSTLLFGFIWTHNYQTIWSLICWSEEDEFGGKGPELFWEFDEGGPTLLVAEFTDAPVNDWEKMNYKEHKYLYWISSSLPFDYIDMRISICLILYIQCRY